MVMPQSENTPDFAMYIYIYQTLTRTQGGVWYYFLTISASQLDTSTAAKHQAAHNIIIFLRRTNRT